MCVVSAQLNHFFFFFFFLTEQTGQVIYSILHIRVGFNCVSSAVRVGQPVSFVSAGVRCAAKYAKYLFLASRFTLRALV